MDIDGDPKPSVYPRLTAKFLAADTTRKRGGERDDDELVAARK